MDTINRIREEWREKFRDEIIGYDDLNATNDKYTNKEPIKGDIYFDGIAIESFIAELLKSQEHKLREEFDKEKGKLISNATGFIEIEMIPEKAMELIKQKVIKELVEKIKELEKQDINKLIRYMNSLGNFTAGSGISEPQAKINYIKALFEDIITLIKDK